MTMTTTHDPHVFALFAEFDSAESLLNATRQVRAAGYRHTEAYTPFPVEGLSRALDYPRSKVDFICLMGGILGASLGYGMCWYASVVSYPWNIGGRPDNSWPAWIPITFEGMVLLAGLSAALSMFYFSGLPRLNHPVFNAPQFIRASRDRFFLEVRATDPKFDLNLTKQFLLSLSACSVSLVEVSDVELA